MKLPNSIPYHQPSQTTPDIFAARIRLPPGSFASGSFSQWAIGFTIGGSCRYRSVTKAWEVFPGDLLLLRPPVWTAWRLPRTVKSGESGDGSWETVHCVFHPRPHWLAWLEGLKITDGIAQLRFQGEASEAVKASMCHLAEVYESRGLLRDDWAMLALETVLMTLRVYTERLQIVRNARVRGAIEIVHGRYADALSVPDIARELGISVVHLSNIFSAEMGVAPGQYLENVRLARAAEMLRLSASDIQDIGRSVGYEYASYFARRFRIKYGQTPRAYRVASRDTPAA